MKNHLVATVDTVVALAQRIAAKFSRLLWRLAFTYILVTVATFTLLLGVVLYITLNLTNTAQIGSTLSLAMMDASSDLAPALSQNPPDQDAVDTWIRRTKAGAALIIARKNVSNQEAVAFSTIAGKATLVLVVDRNGTVIAGSQAGKALASQRLSDSVSPAGQRLLAQALAGETNPLRLFQRDQRNLLAAAPILSPTTHAVLGATFVYLPRVDDLDMLFYVLSATLSSGLYVAIAAAVIGLAFGLVVAHGIEKRLKTVSQSVTAWGQGNFVPRIRDSHSDEIGVLAQEMNKMAAHLAALVQTRQDLAALEERNRLARDLHDSVKQQVFAVSMNLGAAQALWERDPQEARKKLDAASGLARQAQAELTNLIQTLRPAPTETKSLTQALRELVQSWEKQSGIAVSFQARGEGRPLPDAFQQALFRFAQEALANIQKHSGAATAGVTLHVGAEAVQLEISDNGHGFNPGSPHKGLGLLSMRERIQALGGQLDLRSNSQGTCLLAQAPIPKSGAAQVEKETADERSNHSPAG